MLVFSIVFKLLGSSLPPRLYIVFSFPAGILGHTLFVASHSGEYGIYWRKPFKNESIRSVPSSDFCCFVNPSVIPPSSFISSSISFDTSSWSSSFIASSAAAQTFFHTNSFLAASFSHHNIWLKNRFFACSMPSSACLSLDI